MPLPPSRQSDWPPAVLPAESPHAAVLRAIAYRERLREKPRRWRLALVALLGSLLVHLLFLFGAVLGPAYVPEQSAAPYGDVLQVRLIDNKPQPPPPPPVRGTPPKRHGPRHRGRVAEAGRRSRRQTATAMPTAQPLPAVPAAPIDRPVIAMPAQAAASVPKTVAAPLPPVSAPSVAPAPKLQPIVASPPPPVAVVQIAAPKVVPPRFQPQPVRKAQAEGTQPMPSPQSLALPSLPAQSPPAIRVPSVALDKLAPLPATGAMAVTRVEAVAAPPSPPLQNVPLPAVRAPGVNLVSTLRTPVPTVPRERPRIQSPTLRVATAQLATVPLPPAQAAPAAPRIQAPSVAIQSPSLPSAPLALQAPLAKQQATPAPLPAVPIAAAKLPLVQAASTSVALSPNVAMTPRIAIKQPLPTSGASDISSAPVAVPNGSATATPGQPGGTVQKRAPGGPTRVGDFAAPITGQGRVAAAHGHGVRGNPEGTYIQLLPQGDTQIMSHKLKIPPYRPTIFNPYWTPEHESSIDTALRRFEDKTTVSHTFHLPCGVRVKCSASPLMFWKFFAMQCYDPDPPAKPLPAKIYQRLNLPPPPGGSVPNVAPAASAPPPAAATPLKLDDSVECADARLSGGPPPPGCAVAKHYVPAASGSSWVPASDQFQ